MVKSYKLALISLIVSCSLSNAMAPVNTITLIFPDSKFVKKDNCGRESNSIEKTRIIEQIIQIVGIKTFSKRRIVKKLGYYNIDIDQSVLINDNPDASYYHIFFIVPLSEIKDQSGKRLQAGFFKTLKLEILANIRKQQDRKVHNIDQTIKEQIKIFEDNRNNLFGK